MPLLLTEEDLSRALEMASLIPAMRDALARFSRGEVVQPVRPPLKIEPAGGYYSTYSATGLAVNGIPVPANGYLLASLTLSNPSNGQQVGQVLANPPTVGSSTNDFWKGPPPGSWLWFGSTGPVANFYWKIDITPEPASLFLIAGGLLFLRRR